MFDFFSLGDLVFKNSDTMGDLTRKVASKFKYARTGGATDSYFELRLHRGRSNITSGASVCNAVNTDKQLVDTMNMKEAGIESNMVLYWVAASA